MKYVAMLVCAVAVVAATAYGSRHMTVAALSDQNSVFDDFETTQSLWLYSDKIGSAAASGVARAKVALGGPLGLSSQEAVYFVATTDNQGRALSSSCTYRVTGTPIDTRWWSLALYDTQTQHYVPNAINRSSWNSAMIPRDRNGNWVINVSRLPMDDVWLPAHGAEDKPFELNLRVYNPSDAARAALPNMNLPDVEMTSC